MLKCYQGRIYQLQSSHELIDCDVILSGKVVQMSDEAGSDLTHSRRRVWSYGVDNGLGEVWVILHLVFDAAGTSALFEVNIRLLRLYTRGLCELYVGRY
jgi:hypothetical protein